MKTKNNNNKKYPRKFFAYFSINENVWYEKFSSDINSKQGEAQSVLTFDLSIDKFFVLENSLHL